MPIRPLAPPVNPRHSIAPCWDDECEGDGDHRQIGPGDAQGRQGEHRADGGGDDAAERPGQPEVDAVEGQDRNRVGADGIEADMAEAKPGRRARPGC